MLNLDVPLGEQQLQIILVINFTMDFFLMNPTGDEHQNELSQPQEKR